MKTEAFELKQDGQLVGTLIVGLWGPTGEQKWAGQFTVIRNTALGEFNQLFHIKDTGGETCILIDPGGWGWKRTLNEYLANWQDTLVKCIKEDSMGYMSIVETPTDGDNCRYYPLTRAVDEYLQKTIFDYNNIIQERHISPNKRDKFSYSLNRDKQLIFAYTTEQASLKGLLGRL